MMKIPNAVICTNSWYQAIWMAPNEACRDAEAAISRIKRGAFWLPGLVSVSPGRVGGACRL